MKHVTFAEVDAIVKAEIKAEGADFVYGRHDGRLVANQGPACLYAKDGKADCIVGRVFAKLGVPVESMEYVADEDAENRYSTGVADAVMENLRRDDLLDFDVKASKFLTRIQSYQDNGIPWGEAYDRAL
jgi:hypothetical protein